MTIFLYSSHTNFMTTKLAITTLFLMSIGSAFTQLITIIGVVLYALIQITTFREKIKSDYDNSLKKWFDKIILNKK